MTIAAQTAPLHSSESTAQQAFDKARQQFSRQRMPDRAQRKAWLLQLKTMLLDNQQAFIDALNQDFDGRCADETLLAEVLPSVQGIRHAIRHLRSWMRSSWRSPGLLMLPATTKVMYQPLGVVGVIVPWNYPLFLAVGPITAALAAGNQVLLKMPEHTPKTSALFARLIKQYFPDNVIQVIEGGADTAAEFTQLPFDHLLFTGSTQIGKRVMQAAAQNLTPLTLELGGKSPVIINDDARLDMATERICFGKSLNAGQTCVAPDYVLVPEQRLEAFVESYKQAFNKMYPDINQRDYSSIINQAQKQRLQQYLQEAENNGTRIEFLSQASNHDTRLAPALIINANEHSTLLKDEIFGPLLPIIPYKTLTEAIDYINARPRPLALYFFAQNKQDKNRVLEQTHSGGVCINETIFHVVAEDMPFGGIGPSGMGHYHGKEGFLTFSKAKSVLSKGWINSAKFIYPPYNKGLNKLLYKLFIR